MKATLKKFILGLILGLIIAFPLGINYGRNRPLLSNPLAKYDVKTQIKIKAENLIENTKEAIHDATKPNDTNKKH